MVSPISWTASQPASRAWYPVIEIGLKRGSSRAQYSTTSPASWSEGCGGNT